VSDGDDGCVFLFTSFLFLDFLIFRLRYITQGGRGVGYIETPAPDNRINSSVLMNPGSSGLYVRPNASMRLDCKIE
jgi:hypothetical protein